MMAIFCLSLEEFEEHDLSLKSVSGERKEKVTFHFSYCPLKVYFFL